MTKLKPSFKIFLVLLLAGVLFGGYYIFAPKKAEVVPVVENTSDTTFSPTVVETVTSSVNNITTVVSSPTTELSVEPKVETIKNVNSEKKVVKTKKESTKPVEAKKKKKDNERENLNVDFN
jgi:hypothetical protein